MIQVKYLGLDNLEWPHFTLFEDGHMSRPMAIMTREETVRLLDSVKEAVSAHDQDLKNRETVK
jgi:hypothetical protein